MNSSGIIDRRGREILKDNDSRSKLGHDSLDFVASIMPEYGPYCLGWRNWRSLVLFIGEIEELYIYEGKRLLTEVLQTEYRGNHPDYPRRVDERCCIHMDFGMRNRVYVRWSESNLLYTSVTHQNHDKNPQEGAGFRTV